MADRLACRGLPHLEYCPLCDQEEATINHLLPTVYSQENFGLICSDRSVFRACPLSLQSYISMIGGRKLAAAPLMS